ncbi:family 17 glycosyltransferase [Cryphonectria parasitica EP155]|uniref:Family 17 glycosyltransferase n=1 Tax=Cryphonectria parasitica (strain ATCC 38755 / EP155) TaxID=660469 RepID=A0A9P4Y9P9_CRYP1|nr:family 17 glycosyltransferase [Cryphonectria parasitica EP155]KAF3769393.1 family 17 glycosyltransferase [Cryphonectria parasitica EP155]
MSISASSVATELAAAISSTKRLCSTDISQPQFATAVCREHGLEVFDRKPVPKPGLGSGKRKIYDLFIVNNEFDWLEIHLNTTYDFVDYFVVAESPRTATGLDKSLLVRDSWDKLKPYHDKIIYHKLEDPPVFDPRLSLGEDLEGVQRDALFTRVFPRLTGAQAPTEGDILLASDVDEIVRPEALIVLRACTVPQRLTLRCASYFYSFQFRHRDVHWPHPQATTFQGFDGTILPRDLRSGEGTRWRFLASLRRSPVEGDLWNAGWHCSSCFSTVDALLRDMDSLTHMRLDDPEYRDRERIIDRVRKGQDLWDRREKVFDRIENNTDVPASLLGADRRRWRYLVDRNGESAGFMDFP